MTGAEFWRGKRVLLTGHTGFKGAWMALWLERLGADVTGFALAPPDDRDCVFTLAAPWPKLHSIIGDLRDASAVANAAEQSDPEIVIHMAAQALVKRSYADPVETFASNVMGTVNLLSAVAKRPSLRTILVITSDKVYDNNDSGRAFREDDALAGDDPYSASKAGLVGVAKGLALDLAPAGITVNVVAPGWFESPLADEWMHNPKLSAAITGHTAQRRWGTSTDLAAAYQFLASDASAFITGTVLSVDGGYLLV